MTAGFAQHRVILTYGRFDQFNQQHAAFLRQLSTMGSEVIVGCSTDEYAMTSGRPCVQGFDARRSMLECCRFVSRVIAEHTPDQKHADIVNYNVSVIVMDAGLSGQFDDLHAITRVQYLAGSCDSVATPVHQAAVG